MSGDILLGETSLGRQFKEGAKEFWDDFQENDKHTMAIILKQATAVAFESLGEDQEYFEREMRILKASFSNLSAKIRDKAIAKTFEIIGRSAAKIGEGFLKQAMS